MATAPLGLLDHCQMAGTARVVAIGATGFITFRQTPVIGTYNMNGGSVALIVSRQGAILAHIPPQPTPTISPHTGDANTKKMMSYVGLYYDHYRTFHTPVTAHVVCAWYNGTVGLESQMKLIIDGFRGMGLATTEVHHYNVPVDRTAPGHGTVVVVSNRIYVQDRLVAGPGVPPTMPSSAEKPTTTQEASADDAGLELDPRRRPKK